MTEEQMNAYKMRITQAGIGEMTVVMLEMEIQWIDEALLAYAAKDTETFTDCLDKARYVQVELMNVLNMDNTVAADVYSVFSYIHRQLNLTKVKMQPVELARCRDMLKKYYASFQEVAKTDKGGPIMAGSEKVYAGLTYGAGGLVENSMGGTEYTV